MNFDEVLRQAEQERRGADALREAELRKRRDEGMAEERFRESLREFGRWFAQEAKNRGLATQPLLEDRLITPPQTLMRKLRRRGPADEVRELITVGHGWAIFPVHPYHGTIHFGRSVEYNGRKHHYEWDAQRDSASLCLTVDVSGKVRVGAKTLEEGVIVSGLRQRNSYRSSHESIGMGPEALTRSTVLHHVADLGENVSLAQDPEGVARDEDAVRTNRDRGDRLVVQYVAGAKVMLAEA